MEDSRGQISQHSILAHRLPLPSLRNWRCALQLSTLITPSRLLLGGAIEILCIVDRMIAHVFDTSPANKPMPSNVSNALIYA